MRDLAVALAALGLALLIAFLAAQPPAPKAATAPAAQFSAERAMADVRQIAQAPHPSGSTENARVRDYLAARMRQLGMRVELQGGPLPDKAAAKLRRWGDPNASAAQVVNVIGVLPGRDPAAPALLLLAHYDSVWASPGAADDAAGVAAALEIVRALKVRGQPERDVIVLFTDAEELGLRGASMFFEDHPLSGRIGAVINMEARGSGGRAAMFETGPENGRMIALYRDAVSRPFSSSLAVLIYNVMPNRSDFTISKEKGIPGFNFAFIGRSGLYHSPMATPDTLERGALQDIGAQALSVAGALAFGARLPSKAPDAVFGDVLGLVLLAYPTVVGWAILLVSAGLFVFAWLQVRRKTGLTAADALAGLAVAFGFLLHAALLLHLFNILSGSGRGSNYYDRLAALPRLELQAFLICLAAFLIACVVRRPSTRLVAASPALLLVLVGMALGGWSPVLLGVGLAAALTAMISPAGQASVWGGWFGFAFLVFLLALIVQIIAPTAGPLFAWPLLTGAVAAAAAAAIDPRLRRRVALAAVAMLAVLGAAQLLYLGHFTFLGVGAGFAEVAAIYAFLAAMLLWPLFRPAADVRIFGIGAAILLVIAIGLALSVRLDPMAPTIPPYSEQR